MPSFSEPRHDASAYFCTRCGAGSIAAIRCDECERPMVEQKAHVMLPGVDAKRTWGDVAIGGAVGAICILAMAALPMAMYAKHADAWPFLDALGGAPVAFLVITCAILAFRAFRARGAPARRRSAALQNAECSGYEQVSGALSVVEGKTFVVNGAERVRVEIDEATRAFADDGGALLALCDGDEVEVYGLLGSEIGEPDAYRSRGTRRVVSGGATILRRT